MRWYPAFLGLALACARIPSEPAFGTVRVTVDKAEYAAAEKIVVTIENTSAEAVYLYHCDFKVGLSLERRGDVKWLEEGAVNGPLCPAHLLSGSLALASGSIRTETLVLDRNGDYRVRIGIQTVDGNVSRSVVSPSFAVRD